MDETEQKTPEQVLAASIRYHREERLKWSAQELADRVQELGGSLFRQAISKVEVGKRSVSIDELMYLARAMKMSPLLLLFPVGTQTDRIPGDVSVAGEALDMWTAAKWFVGEGYPAEDVAEHWAIPLYLHRQYDRWLGELVEAQATQLFAPEAEGQEQKQKRAEHEVKRVRAEMVRHGLTPPLLPPGLEYLDAAPYLYLNADEVEERRVNGKTIRLVDNARGGGGKPLKAGDAARYQRQLGPGSRMLFEESEDAGNE